MTAPVENTVTSPPIYPTKITDLNGNASRHSRPYRHETEHGFHWKRWKLLALLSILALFGIWWLLTSLHVTSRVILPTPSDVIHEFWVVATKGFQGQVLSTDIEVSMEQIGLGLAGAIILGVPIGLIIGFSKLADALFDPYIQFLRPLPPLGYYTLLIVWFGIGNISKILLLILTGLPIIAVATTAGVRAVSISWIRVAYSLGMNRKQLLTQIVFRATIPDIVTGTRIATGAIFGSLVAAELIAANSGLGWLILNASNFVRTGIVIMALILIGMIAIILDRIFVKLDRTLAPWKSKQ